MTVVNIYSQKKGIGIGQVHANTNYSSISINENWKVIGFYPVSSLFFNINDINPTNYFGGTWERFGKGKVLVGVDENDTNFSTVEKTGGESTHTLTTSEMPSHRHQVSALTDTAAGDGTIGYPVNSDYDWAFTNEPIGGGQPHNNLMPFATCYIWKRTA